jgi:hypothetical protein
MLALYGGNCFAAGEIVLCIEKNGHSQFEFAIGGECATPCQSLSGPNDQLSVVEPEIASTHDEHCHECQDHPISVYATSVSKQHSLIFETSKISCDITRFINSLCAIDHDKIKPVESPSHDRQSVYPLFLSSILLRL